MQIGLFSNGERHNKVAKVTYDEDLAEVILADELGLQEAQARRQARRGSGV